MDAGYISLSSLEHDKKNDASAVSNTAQLLPQDDFSAIKYRKRPPFLSRTTSPLANTLKYIHRSWTWYLTSHILSLLWLAPIVAVLVLNFESHIIGASAWCPLGKCYDDSFLDAAPIGVSSQNELDRRDHNLLGTLQFVAKAIEVWFTFIATSLILDAIMLLAKSSSGIPLGFLLTHLQFSDVRNLANPLLWTSARISGTQSKRIRRIPFYFFVALAIFLTILTNLMGPSFAALLIPALQWVQIFNQPQQHFQVISSGQPPSGDDVFPGTCISANLSASQYACTSPDFAPSLDSIAAFVDSSYQDVFSPEEIVIPLLKENIVSFEFNISLQSLIVWSPNRQVLRNISIDYAYFANTISGNTNYTVGNETGNNMSPPKDKLAALNRSLSTSVQRQGPSLGLASSSSCGVGNLLEITDISPSSDQTVRCLGGRPATDDEGNASLYTKCYRTHQGWNETNTFYTFSLDPASGNRTEGSFSVGRTLVDVYFSDKAVYFNTTTDFGSGMAECYKDSGQNQGKSAPSCDWDKIFSTEMPSFLANSSSNVQNTEYYPATAASNSSSRHVFCDSIAVLGFTTYSLDASLITNPDRTVLLGSFPAPEDLPSVVFDPTWILAAWSVNPGSSVDSSRAMVINMQRTIQSLQDLDLSSLNNSQLANFSGTNDQNEFMSLHSLTVLQAMSMVDYNFTNATTFKGASTAQPVLGTSISIRVWAFGITSRTAILGVVVSIAGILVVLGRLVLALVTRTKDDHSDLELLVAALEYTNLGDFAGLHHERDQGRVRYQILENSEGKAVFVPKKSV